MNNQKGLNHNGRFAFKSMFSWKTTQFRIRLRNEKTYVCIWTRDDQHIFPTVKSESRLGATKNRRGDERKGCRHCRLTLSEKGEDVSTDITHSSRNFYNSLVKMNVSWQRRQISLIIPREMSDFGKNMHFICRHRCFHLRKISLPV